MGGKFRFTTTLITTTPSLSLSLLRPSLFLLHHHHLPPTLPLLRPLSLRSPSPPKPFNALTHISCFHSNTALQQQGRSHPWPEWTRFLDFLSSGQAVSGLYEDVVKEEDGFVAYEKVSDEFARAAAACLAFARYRPHLIGLLSRRDMEVVVSNGTPFLFKRALDTARRMKSYLGIDGSNEVSEPGKAGMIDLMKYMLSYASNATTSYEGNSLYSRELVDSSIRNLLQELVSVSSGNSARDVPNQENQFSGRYGQTPRPLGQNIEMKRGDWICPKCSFMNFARNMNCLECEEARPKRQLTGGEWECPQCNFFNYGKNMACLRCDIRRPGVPLQNTFNTRSGPGYNGDYTYKNNDSRFSENVQMANNGYPNDTSMAPNTSISRGLDQNNQYSQRRNSNHVPFVPLSPDMFSRTGQNAKTEDVEKSSIQSPESVPPEVRNQDISAVNMNSEDSQSSTALSDNKDKEREEAEKSERWFRKLAELHDVKDLPSAISDEDFPEIMPMRKGENRFVVSKKKDRSLTSPKYKRQVAMDQANNSNFVPFVPFPPGYFARKEETQQPSSTDSSATRLRNDSPSSSTSSHSEKSDDCRYGLSDNNPMTRKDDQPIRSGNLGTSSNYVSPPSKNSVQSSTIRSDVYQAKQNAEASTQLPETQNTGSKWTGTSLEGSAVKEPDPLDMSEEAKAERWFKRVAQIKDISELSQIPDEDFPSIMPMRKGVNRFVVSKRKTPLERRLTSQQYRRNLPIVNSAPLKKEVDNSGKEE